MIKDEIKMEMGIAWNFEHITYEEKIKRAFNEWFDTDPKKIMSWWWKVWDDVLGGIYGWKIYVIGADTGIGKSTFVNQICRNLASSWVKVVKYSLEDRMEDLGKEEIYYEVNRMRKLDGKPWYLWTDFVNKKITGEEIMVYVGKAVEKLMAINITELDKQKQVNIEELVYLMEEECKKWARAFAIDHLHYFEMKDGKERHDLQIQNIMHNINEVARKYNVAVFLIAHYKMWKQPWTPSYDNFKDGAAIKQVANIIIQIDRDTDTTKSQFYITKIRWPIKPCVIDADFNIWTFEYDFKPMTKKHFGVV